jgi:hypothetical protein
VGAIRVDRYFARLEPNEIYDRSWNYKHCVVLVGFVLGGSLIDYTLSFLTVMVRHSARMDVPSTPGI